MLKFYNTLTKKKEIFKPIVSKKVGLYSCGPTVYDFAHLGNFRAYVFVDILKKYLQYKGYRVKHVMNLTDIDDKTIKRSQKEEISLNKLTAHYTEEFLKDSDFMHIAAAEIMPRATENIEAMVALVQKLLKKGVAYKTEDGSIYFSIDKFKSYGKIANLSKQDLKKNAEGRLCASDEYNKEDVRDFVLWKSYSKEDGDVFWETPLGKGRPGWHIECSVMSMKYLGSSFDIHTGGIDLVFPHHTNEIAQSEAATGKQYVKYWLHNGHLLVSGKKMSKSLGNFFTIRDLKEKGYSGRALRYLLARVHYRQKMDFKESLVEEAQNVLEKFDNFVAGLQGKGVKNNKKINPLIKKLKKDFEAAMDDDIDISLSLAAIFDFIKKINYLEGNISTDDAEKVKQVLKEIDEVLGFIFEKTKVSSSKNIRMSKQTIEALIKERNEARKNKDFARADEIRKRLEKQGIELIDAKEGTIFKIK